MTSFSGGRRTSSSYDPGELGAGLTHELRNLLFAVTSRLEGTEPSGLGVDPTELGEALADLGRIGALLDDYERLMWPLRNDAAESDMGELLRLALASVVTAGGVGRASWPEGPIAVRCDRSGIVAALRTLLLAAGPPVTGVGVTLEVNERCAVIVVDGPGATPRVARLFEPYAVRVAGGTRLSLAIAHATLRANGGDARASATEAGIRIVATLPLADDTAG